MADRIFGITTRFRWALVASFAGMLMLTGCEAVKMPDLSEIDFGLQQRPSVTIKSGYDKVNIRPSPSTAQPPIASVKGGDQLKLFAEEGSWLNVVFYDTAGNEQKGWVYKYLVEGYEKPQSGSVVTSGRGEALADEEEPLMIEEAPAKVEPTTGDLPKSEKVSPL